jgi:hypothetical protein
MNIRALIYWVGTLVVATYAAGHAFASAPEIETAVAPVANPFLNLLAVPDSARSVLLFVGILAVAYTYQRAWANFRGGPAA